MENLRIRIAGANGDGIESAARMLSKIAAKSGFHIFGFRSYQSLIRGGSVWFQLRVSNEKEMSYGGNADILISLDIDGIKNNIDQVEANGVVIYDTKLGDMEKLFGARGIEFVPVPMLDTAVEFGGSSIYRNTLVSGILAQLLGLQIDIVNKTIEEVMAGKQNLIEPNLRVAKAGYNIELKLHNSYKMSAPDARGVKYLLNGNEALAIGAANADCDFYAAYPMTPASSILEWFASHENHGVLYKQTEDEIAAINMTIGAAYAGVRAMCGTSGGGFSLMVEGLGLAGMLEVPIVVVESQRGGPSTGLPTKTEQGDLLFVINASQGDFPRIVIAPRNIEECYYETANAFNLAERYQCPVIVLMDLYMSEHFETVDIDPNKVTINRGLVESGAKEAFKRYMLTENGISPRSLPGTKGLAYVAASDEHDEYGNLVSDVRAGTPEGIETRIKMHEKRLKKMQTMINEGVIKMPSVLNEDADVFLVTFGSSAMGCTEAVNILKKRGINAGAISFSYMHPMDSSKVRALLLGKRLIDVEGNATAQLARLITMNTGIEIKDRILRYDGEAMTGSYIADIAYKILKGE